MPKNARNVLDLLKQRGAKYADIRLHLNDLSEEISINRNDVEGHHITNKSGYGIRVLFDGAWGFASGENFSEMKRVADMALENAKAASHFIQNKIQLTPKEIIQTEFKSPCKIDPFTISAKDKIDHLHSLHKKMEDSRFDFWLTGVLFQKREILFLDTEGAEVHKTIVDVNGFHAIQGKDKDGLSQKRGFTAYLDADGTRGYETVTSKDFDRGEQLKQEIFQVFDAPVCEKERCDVALLPEMMALQTHETIGHALELDRILGYELSYAGGSHVTLDDFGKLQFGSSKLTARADGTIHNSPGSTGGDDDGSPARNVTLIENGILKSAISSRQSTYEANVKAGRDIFRESGGSCRAEDYSKLPIDRMNNINVDYGTDGTRDEIISKIENGIMLEAPRSWSIGSNRENFHFATQIGWKIKDGKISHVVRNPSYRGDSLDFWKSLKFVGDKSTWQMQQVFHCGKGQPNQIMRLGHGVPFCVFENVQVGD